MIAVTRSTGRRTQIATHDHGFVVHAFRISSELIRLNAIALHVFGIGMTALASVGYVERMDTGACVGRRTNIVDAVTIGADRNLDVASQ